MTTERDPGRRRVRVWYGRYPVCDFTADPDEAEAYAELVDRLGGTRVRVTVDNLASRCDPILPPKSRWADVVPS